ncbi:MAG TPA: SHOCT domain-containing protein [Acidimicrobiia bacterium]
MGEPSLEELRASGGKPARALISETKSGRKWKADPSQIVWKVTMRVMPDDAGPFNATIQAPYPAGEGGPSLGSLVGVLYDPRDTSKVAIDPTAPAESWGQVQAAQMNHTVEQAMAQSTGGAAIFTGGRWIQGGPGAPPASAAAPPSTDQGSSLASELEKLASLRDRGALTDAEFQAQKAKLLGT